MVKRIIQVARKTAKIMVVFGQEELAMNVFAEIEIKKY
jgi:hypothetical protein